MLQNFGARVLLLASGIGDVAITVCPEASQELKALGVRVEDGIDITSDDSVANLHERLGET